MYAATPPPKRRMTPPEASPSSSPASSSSSSSAAGATAAYSSHGGGSSRRYRLTVIALVATATLGGSCFQLGLMVGMEAGRRHGAVEGGGSGGATLSSSSSSQSHADTGHLLDVRITRQQQGPACSCVGVPLTNETEAAVQQSLRRSSAAPHLPPFQEENASNDASQASSSTETTAPNGNGGADEPSRRHSRRRQPPKVSNLVAGYEIVKRRDFASVVDTGVPLDPADAEKDDVLILYTSTSGLPNRTNSGSDLTASRAVRAVENCLTVRVVLTEQDVKSNCIAIMGHPEESYHVHRFHRIQLRDPKGGGGSREVLKVGRDVPLTPVPRIVETRGDLRDEVVPSRRVADRYVKDLVRYWSQLPDTLARLRPIARTAAGGTEGGPVVAMTVNKGQSELLLNFVCAAKARNLDVSRVLVFATDPATAQLASGLGVHVFAVRGAFGNIPVKAAADYGDDDFGRIVLAKIYCVHLLVLLGHDVLLQDVDVVWYRNPLEYFTPARFQQFDMIFQDDGNTSPRFAPYFANTGMYFVRSNARTVHLYSHLARMGDVLRQLRCDQEMIAAYLAEHVSWTGLRVKVLGANTEDGLLFPGGFHYNDHDDYMRQLLKGEVVPYAFHMSWTANKHEKIKFWAQMGEWRVQPFCLDNSKQGLVTVPATGIGPARTAAADACCSAEPLVTCHYRDKPSLVDCRDSPSTSDGGDDPFWPTPFNGTATAAAAAAA
jgi:Nucleotide-diphospho-sugar transferase